MAALFQAAENQEWEKVEVRLPLRAAFYSGRGPSRGVPLELGRRTLIVCRIHPTPSRPALSNFSVRMRAPLLCGHNVKSDPKFRGCTRLYDPLQACRISEFLAAASARNRRFRDVCARTRYQAAARGRTASTPSPLGARGVLLPSTYDKTETWSTLGACLLFCVRFTEPPHPSPAVHSDGDTALHWAAVTGRSTAIAESPEN
jgi:hypothetical protein